MAVMLTQNSTDLTSLLVMPSKTVWTITPLSKRLTLEFDHDTFFPHTMIFLRSSWMTYMAISFDIIVIIVHRVIIPVQL